jgi:hypothetical protein
MSESRSATSNICKFGSTMIYDFYFSKHPTTLLLLYSEYKPTPTSTFLLQCNSIKPRGFFFLFPENLTISYSATVQISNGKNKNGRIVGYTQFPWRSSGRESKSESGRTNGRRVVLLSGPLQLATAHRRLRSL